MRAQTERRNKLKKKKKGGGERDIRRNKENEVRTGLQIG